MDYLLGWNSPHNIPLMSAFRRNPLLAGFLVILQARVAKLCTRKDRTDLRIYPSLGLFILLRYATCIVLSGNRDDESPSMKIAINALN